MKRRGHGEGTVFQRKSDGSWHAQIDLGWVDGTRKRITRRCASQREAIAALKVLQEEYSNGRRPIPDKYTVAHFLEDWFEECVKGKKKPSTEADYEANIRLYLKPSLGKIPLKDLRPMEVQRMINGLAERGLGRAPEYARTVLRGALKTAQEWEYIDSNPAALVKVPKHKREPEKPLNPEEARRFLQFAKGHRLEALFTVAVSIGLREGEAFALRWRDVDLDAGVLRVRHSLDRTTRPWQLVEPKTARSKRTISLPAVCREALREHRKRQEEERVFQGSRWQDHDFVFPSSIGTPLDCNNVLKQFRKLLALAGIAPRRFHDLRHTCATLLLAQGVHPRIVMELLGHSSITITMNLYSHVTRPMQDQAAEKMDALLMAVNLAVTETKKAN